MRIRILGSAAGGGFPQWNCNCPGCQAVRAGRLNTRTRMQSSLAVQVGAESWYIVNASPDIRQQLEYLRESVPDSVRSNPIAGVLLTDAEIDHTAGLMILRESDDPLPVYSTDTVRQALTDNWPLFDVLKSYCGVKWSALEPGVTFSLSGSSGTEAGTEFGVEVEVFCLPSKPPKYARTKHARSESAAADDWVIGLTFRDRTSGKVVTYAPAVADYSPSVIDRLEASDCIFVDGTCWQDDELVKLGISTRTARQMGHLPLSGEDGSLAQLAKLTCDRKILVHINNTNPILLADSEARKTVERAGIEVGYDGLTVEL